MKEPDKKYCDMCNCEISIDESLCDYCEMINDEQMSEDRMNES